MAEPVLFIMWGILALLLILAGVAIYLKKKYKTPTDYYSLFIMGIIWIPLGIPLKNYALSGMGLVFMIIGLVNKKKWNKKKRTWKDLSKEEKKVQKIILIMLSVFLLIGIIAFFLLQRAH